MAYATFGVSDPFDPDHKLVTSPLFSPLVLACIRIFLGLYSVFVLIFVLAWDSVYYPFYLHGYFAYFTHLSYIGLCAYFWASGVQTVFYVVARGRGYPLQRWPKILQFFHLLLFATVATFPFITTIVFWSLLSSSATFDTKFNAWSNISVHAMNSVFALFELLLTRAGPVPFTHLPFCVLLLALYLGVTYITYASQGFYTYSFFDPRIEHGLIAAYVVGIAIGECILYSFSWALCYVRDRLISKSRKHAADVSDDWEQVSRQSPAMTNPC